MEDIVRSKFSSLTPLIMKFIKQANVYFAQASSGFIDMKKKCSSVHIQPIEEIK